MGYPNLTDSAKPPSFIGPNSAAVISLTLCVPFLFSYITAMFEPKPFMHLLTSDGFRPTILGTIMVFAGLLGLPVAFLINLLPMVRKAGSKRATPFKLTPAHSIVGLSTLLVVLVASADMVLYELRPFVTPLGSGARLGQILFFLGLLALPLAFLLNLLPGFAKAGSGGALTFQPTSINLIIGAAILFLVLMIASAFTLEEIACSIGIPNCD